MPRGKKVRYRTGEKALTPKDQGKLLGVIVKFFDEVLIKLTLALGCRRSDIVRIRWVNINFEEFCVSYMEKKKGNAIHTAYISKDMVLLLKKYRDIVKGPFLFPNQKNENKCIDGKTAYNKFNRLMRKAGLIGLDDSHPFHALRSTCIKNCDRADWSKEEAAEHVNDSLEVIEYHYRTPSALERKEVALEKPII